jgi:hypothetical protein
VKTIKKKRKILLQNINMINVGILQNGEPLSDRLYNIDYVYKNFSTNESNLVLDFNNEEGWSFKTGGSCIFKTGIDCVFDTGSHCDFYTSDFCRFTTRHTCTFDTGSHCDFNTGGACKFETGGFCNFITGSGCNVITTINSNFHTRHYCKFETGGECVFETGVYCVFNLDDSGVLVYKRNHILNILKGDSSIILPGGILIYIKNKNDALLNLKHKDEYVRKYCEKILKGEKRI